MFTHQKQCLMTIKALRYAKKSETILYSDDVQGIFVRKHFNDFR
jgi:hypothetical protein